MCYTVNFTQFQLHLYINVLSFAFDNLYSMLYIFNTKDDCSLQLKHTGALQPTVQLVGNKFYA